MLTLFYASATFLQSWRIKNVCNKITEQLAMQSSVAFYVLPASTSDGFDAALATSELCINRKGAKVSEILWLHCNTRGCSLRPLQKVHITPWISFPDAPSWLPMARKAPEEKFLERLACKKDILYLLVETDIKPCYKNSRDEHVVHIEDYGKLIAWRFDSNLALLLETDVEHFTKLLYSTFLRNQFLINDQLNLLRIESISYEGKPQPFEKLGLHLRKTTRNAAKLSDDEWEKHLNDLRSLSILANQATEFEYNKNRTEGKTGVVKPDLIPAEKKAAQESANAGAASASTNTKLESIEIAAKSEVATPSKATKVVEVSGDSKTKMIAKPTVIKKPSEHRFKTTRVAEPPVGTPSKTETVPPIAARKTSPARGTTKPVELEKIAAASVMSAHGHKSPLHAITPSPASTVAQKLKTSAEPESSAVKPSATLPATEASTTDAPVKTSTNSVPPINSVGGESSISANKDNTKRPALQRNKDSLNESKPPNILVYSDSASARESAVTTLKNIVEENMYTVYSMTTSQAEQKHWLENTALLVVCGAVASNLAEIFVDFFLRGGRVLSICSDILYNVLPTYRTAEIREHELVQFSYDKWEKVKMMHHIFCYQPSPVRKNFSTDSDDSGPQANVKKQPALLCPRSIELKDLQGAAHNLDVKVLGTEETWQTPSLMLAHSIKSDGKALFSQIHLEIDPSQFESDETKYSVLKENEKIRLDIFADLLTRHLNVSVKNSREVDSPPMASPGEKHVYPNAYFLGLHESKRELLEKLANRKTGGAGPLINTKNLTIKFCDNDEQKSSAAWSGASGVVLPILKHSCPEDFSTVDYFNNLKTKYIGRLVIYAPEVNSSMNVINELELTNGIAVLPRQQTAGEGRSSNQWLSPRGCAMFSIQLHMSLGSPLGARLSLLQHVIGLAVVQAIRSHDDYRVLDIGLKWPNDIYANRVNKIGGLIVKTTIMGTNAIVNIGCGINLDNSMPTICINDLIKDYNKGNIKNLPLLKYEIFLALVFNEIEKILDQVESGNFNDFYKSYHALWLHKEQSITICDKDNKQRDAKVIGIDDYGYLQVKLSTGTIETVQPDGNSFDMLKGLIVPKFN